MVTIKIDNSRFLKIFMFLFVLAVTSYALAVWSSPPVSHDAIGVKVTISGTDYSLQEAIDDGLLSGGGGGTTLPSCSNGQVVKWNGATWACASDIDTNTDTKCNSAGSCSQVCIGSVCRTSWVAATCTWSDGSTYTAGAQCNAGTSCEFSGMNLIATCSASGWSTNSVYGAPCPQYC
jgi:hypothetical protein